MRGFLQGDEPDRLLQLASRHIDAEAYEEAGQVLDDILAVNPVLYAKVPYDPVRDFAPISNLSISPIVIAVHPSIPARTPKEFIALAKARPGKLIFARAGTGTSNHLAAELFQIMTATKLVQVPYKGSGPALIDLVGGQADLTFDQLSSSLPYIRAGKLRAVAVTTEKRSFALPDVPTLDESGVKGYEANTFASLMAPAATPRDIISRLNAAIVKIVNSPDMREAYMRQGLDPSPGTPEEFGAFIRNEIAQNIKLVKAAGIQPE